MKTMELSKTLALGVLGLSLALVGCEEKKEPAPAAAPAKPAAEVKPVAQKAPEPVALDSIPTEEDFEEEAQKEVTAENLDQQLDSLEKEIQGE